MKKIAAYNVHEKEIDGKLVSVKMCYKCKEIKPISEIQFRKDRSIDGAELCRACKNSYLKEYYRRDIEARRKYQREWEAKRRNPQHLNRLRGKVKREVKAWLRSLKTDNPCMDCGRYFHFAVMDFDHARSNKEFQISTARSFAVSQEELMEELYKCDLVCSNCHRLRTYLRRQKSTSLITGV